MSEKSYTPIEDLSENEIYNLMNSGDKIQEGMLCNFPSEVYVAFDSINRIVAAGGYGVRDHNPVYTKAVARSCLNPIIIKASSLPKRLIDEHNKRLEEVLSKEELAN